MLVSPPPNPLLPRRIYAAAQVSELTAETVREISRDSREQTPESAIAFLLVPEARPWFDDPERALTMRTTATSVIVLDPDALRDIAAAAEPPQQALAAHVLRQADLTKASPFVHSGVTPPRVFAGRGGEEASIVAD